VRADDTAGRRAQAAHGGPRSSRWHALLATVEYVVDSPGRTQNARRLLLPVLVSAVLLVSAVATVAVLVAPGWTLGAIGAAGTGAVVSGYRRLSRAAPWRSRR
jgi:hypothetical protein